MNNPDEIDSYDFPENDDDYDDDDDNGDDYWQYGYCGFCGEELSTSSSGFQRCGNCGYDDKERFNPEYIPERDNWSDDNDPLDGRDQLHKAF